MNKKCLVILLVLVFALTGLCAKESGFKVGGQLGWGFDILRLHVTGDGDDYAENVTNNGFAFTLLGEYAFNKNWSVEANLGMMCAGKGVIAYFGDASNTDPDKSNKRAGLNFDFAIDGKYTFAINEKVSVSGLAGLEMLYGYLLKGTNEFECFNYYTDSDFKNFAFGLNLGLEGSYKLTDKISIVGGATGAWFFVNTSNYIKDNVNDAKEEGNNISVVNFYIRPYVGATYAF